MCQLTRHTVLMCFSALLILHGYDAQVADYPQEHTVQCVDDKDPPEVYLSCDSGRVINILEAHVGYQEHDLTDETTCVIKVEDPCTVSMTTYDPLLRACMGRRSCNKVAYHPERDKCQKPVNYIQVLYECIPDNSLDPHVILDICGDSLGSTQSISRDQGYIQSLGYPGDYSPLTSCTCQLSIPDQQADSGAAIHLQLLDIDLGQDERTSRARDWLEYTLDADHWGEGHGLHELQRNKVQVVTETRIFLNFHTDGSQQSRGFWISYKGVKKDEETPTKVDVTCSEFTPPDHKSDITCFQEEGVGELYLSCRSQGVISIVSAIRGHHPDMTSESCDKVKAVNCSESASDDQTLYGQCMGQVECNPPARKMALRDCDQDSNFVQVTYQCIEEDEDGSSIIDMCGDATGTTTIERTVGYLETLSYPSAYLPSQKCTCRVQSLYSDTEVVLSLVDLSLDHSDCQKTQDWLEYTVGEQNWGRGVRLCGNIPGEIIHTGAQKIYANFYSNENVEGRGAWIKYMGRTRDGVLKPVRVICGDYYPGKDFPEDPLVVTDGLPDTPGTGDEATAPGTNTGLIAGLVVLILLVIVCVVLILIFVRYRRPAALSRKAGGGATDSPSPSASTVSSDRPDTINRIGAGYGTLKYPGFSTRRDAGLHVPYSNLDNDHATHVKDSSWLRERSQTTAISRISGSRPDPGSSGSSSSCGSSEPVPGRSKVAYNNPTFEYSTVMRPTNTERTKHVKI